MFEKAKADIYLAYLDRILAGEKDIGPVDDAEIDRLLLLAKTMLAADLSTDSKMRESLRKKLWVQIKEKNESSLSGLLRNDDELDEDALNYVAAGIEPDGEQKDICPYCGARVQNLKRQCPFCKH